MPVHDWSHDDFPEWTATATGVREIDGGPAGGRHLFVQLDLTYAVKDGRPLRVAIIGSGLDWATTYPDGSDPATYPLVVFVQGSGWRDQQLGVNLLPLAEIARRGYVVALVEHRPSSVAAFPAQGGAVLPATRWLMDRAAERHIDPERVALWGDSSGGHTAALVAVTGHDPSFSDEPDRPPVPFRCFVDFYGPTDLGAMDDEPTTTAHNAAGSAESALLGGSALPDLAELVRRADPRTHVRSDRRLAPMLIAHGTKDRLVPYAQSVLLYDTLREAGQPVELVKVRGAAHGGTTFWTGELLDLVAEFLDRHLRA